MTPAAETHRPELESLIVNQLRELKGLESGLNRQFAGLRFAPPKTREAFFEKILDLEQRARQLELLIDALVAE